MNESRPRVTVGLPVYNGEVYVGEAIESILNQTYRDFEFIICDNASTDATSVICREWAGRDPRIRYIRNETNIGAIPNQNRVIELARGTYFMYMTHDDRRDPREIEECVKVLDRDPAVVVAHSSIYQIDAEGRMIGPHDEDLHLVAERPHQRVWKGVVKFVFAKAEMGLMRLEVLRKTRLVQPCRSSDYVLIVEMALYGKIFQLPERMFYHRFHEASSIRANKTPRSLALWMDPACRSSGRFYKVRLWVEYMRGVMRGSIGPVEKLLCLLAVQRYVIQGLRNWIGRNRRLVFARLTAIGGRATES